jgi:hypothetical protein
MLSFSLSLYARKRKQKEKERERIKRLGLVLIGLVDQGRKRKKLLFLKHASRHFLIFCFKHGPGTPLLLLATSGFAKQSFNH